MSAQTAPTQDLILELAESKTPKKSEKQLEMNLLFSNIKNLLGRNLTKYPPHFIERKLIKGLEGFLKDIKENSNALYDSESKFNSNNFSFDLIPDFKEAYELYEKEFKNIFPKNLSENFNNFLGILEKKINKFYNTKKIDKGSKGVLIKFFEKLNEKYE